MLPNQDLASNREKLRQFLSAESETLARTLRLYAWRAGLPHDESAVAELLNDTTVEALNYAERYDPARPARAWLLGIAANLVKRRAASAARLNRREPLAADLDPSLSTLSEEEIFERLPLFAESPEADDPPVEPGLARQLWAALAQLSSADQTAIRLFAEGGLSGEALAARLNIRPGAARVRLHRALNRLRAKMSVLSDASLAQRKEVDHD